MRRYLPSPERIREQKALGFLRHRLADPSLWHLNRRSASLAMFWGLICAFLPIPLQMVPATVIAIILRINLPLMMFLVWLTNPLTMIPFIYASYWVGSRILGVPMLDKQHLIALWSKLWDSLTHASKLAADAEMAGTGINGAAQHVVAAQASLLHQLEPFLLGSVILGVALGVFGYVAMRAYWRWHVVRAWRARAKKRALAVKP